MKVCIRHTLLWQQASGGSLHQGSAAAVKTIRTSHVGAGDGPGGACTHMPHQQGAAAVQATRAVLVEVVIRLGHAQGGL